MRVLFVTSFFEPDEGAASVLLSRLAKQLSERGHQITVLTTLPNYPHGRIFEGYRGKLVKVEDRDGVRVIQTWLWATSSPRISRKLISQMTFMVTAAVRGIAIPKADIIFIESQPIFTNLVGFFLSRIQGTPFVLNIGDLWPDHLLTVGSITETHPIYRVARRIVDATYRRAAGIVVASSIWGDIIQCYIGATDKICPIYLGVDLSRFRPGLNTTTFRKKYGFGDEKLITFIGTFATQYDFETLFETAKQYSQRENVRFVFIGGGSQSDLVREKIESGTYENVRWIPWIDHAEMPAAWNASFITFWAMRNQALYRGTLPGKLYEAMACATPIVAATEGVGASMLTESGGGFAVPFGDVAGMCDAINRLLDSPSLYEQTQQKARAYAEQHFDSNQIAAAYEAALQHAVQR